MADASTPSDVIDHADAWDLANEHKGTSNLARSYLDLRAALQPFATMATCAIRPGTPKYDEGAGLFVSFKSVIRFGDNAELILPDSQ